MLCCGVSSSRGTRKKESDSVMIPANNINQSQPQPTAPSQAIPTPAAVVDNDGQKDKDKDIKDGGKKKRYTRQELTFSKLTGTTGTGSTASEVVAADLRPNHVKLEFPDLVPFSIEDCKDCNLFLFSSLAQCTIDACNNCFIFIGPSEGPVFLRDCSDCVVVVACQQLRLRDCKNITLSLYAKGQPIIESSSDITFACFTYNYPALLDQFKKANLDVNASSNWNSIHDFTPSQTDQQNMRILEIPLEPSLLKTPPQDMIDFPISTVPSESAVPFPAK